MVVHRAPLVAGELVYEKFHFYRLLGSFSIKGYVSTGKDSACAFADFDCEIDLRGSANGYLRQCPRAV
jgi:hypothetical protein